MSKEYTITGKLKVKIDRLDGNNGYIVIFYIINNSAIYDQLFIDCSGGFVNERKDEILNFLDCLDIEYEVEDFGEIERDKVIEFEIIEIAPDELIEIRIGSMKENQRYYMDSWDIYCDTNKNMWIASHTKVNSVRSKDKQIEIRKDDDNIIISYSDVYASGSNLIPMMPTDYFVYNEWNKVLLEKRK